MPAPEGLLDAEMSHPYWRRNLIVCLFGSFTTVVAMTLLLPYLPLYVERLGVRGDGAVARWSGVAYAATFLTAALSAPVWGRLGDRHGRKPMLVRASLGMAVTMSALGLVHNVQQLVGLRLLAGLVGGFASGSTILVAAQTPRDRSAWALGVLSVGTMSGTVAGPLVGGWLPTVIGIRATFLASGALIFIAFLGTVVFLQDERSPSAATAATSTRVVTHRRRVTVLLATSSMVMFATTSIEPILTLFVRSIDPGSAHPSGLAGIAFAATALGSIISAARMGRLADRWGHDRVIIASLLTAAVVSLLQTAVHQVWQLVALRLIMGLAIGGLLPSVFAAIRRLVPDGRVGQVLGLAVSAQYAGQVLGPLAGGLVASHAPLTSTFVVTAGVLVLVAMFLGSVGRERR